MIIRQHVCDDARQVLSQYHNGCKHIKVVDMFLITFVTIVEEKGITLHFPSDFFTAENACTHAV